MAELTKRKPQKQSLKGGHHVLTLRLLPEDFEHLKSVQARRQKRQKRQKIGYTEIMVQSLRALR